MGMTVLCTDDYLRGATALNKVMRNFASAARALLSKEYGWKELMPNLKPHLGSIAFEPDCKCLCRRKGAEYAQSATLPAL